MNYVNDSGSPVHYQDNLRLNSISAVQLSNAQLAAAQKIYNTGIVAGLTSRQAMYIVAQSAFESAYWTSNVYIKNLNGYGMKMPYVRKSPYILGPGTPAPAGEGGGYYAKFSSIENSAKDFLHWFNYVGGKWANMTTDERFVDFLKSKQYFQGTLSSYKAGVDRLTRELGAYIKKNDSPLIGLAALALLVIIVGGKR